MTDLLRHFMNISKTSHKGDYVSNLKEAIQHIALLGL